MIVDRLFEQVHVQREELGTSKRRTIESFDTVFVELPEKWQEHREEDGGAL